MFTSQQQIINKPSNFIKKSKLTFTYNFYVSNRKKCINNLTNSFCLKLLHFNKYLHIYITNNTFYYINYFIVIMSQYFLRKQVLVRYFASD